MSSHYPLKFTLEDGVKVEVDKVSNNTYEFILTSEHGAPRTFSFADDRPKDELIKTLDFDQLNAVRRFWLEQEDMD